VPLSHGSGNCVKANGLGGILLLACKTLLPVRQPSRLTTGLVWLPAWSNRTLLQVLAFLAVSLPPNSLICHGYLAFHGYFLKASEVCFAAHMGLIAGVGSDGGIPPQITVNQGQRNNVPNSVLDQKLYTKAFLCSWAYTAVEMSSSVTAWRYMLELCLAHAVILAGCRHWPGLGTRRKWLKVGSVCSVLG